MCKTGNNDWLVTSVRKSNQFNFKLPLSGVVLPLAIAQYFECGCGCNWLSNFEVFKISTDFFRRKVCNWERYLRCVGFFFKVRCCDCHRVSTHKSLLYWGKKLPLIMMNDFSNVFRFILKVGVCGVNVLLLCLVKYLGFRCVKNAKCFV